MKQQKPSVGMGNVPDTPPYNKRPAERSECLSPTDESTLLSTVCPLSNGTRILLVDDDLGVRESLSAALRSEGYAVLSAPDGRAALRLVAESSFDLILLDLNMPQMNGWDAFERLSSEYPMIPIIVITAQPNQGFTAINAGVGALMEKPLDMAALFSIIAMLLAEPAEVRLARLAGVGGKFIWRPRSDDTESGS